MFERFIHIVHTSSLCFLMLYNVPVNEHTEVHLPILLLVDVWNLSSFWLLKQRCSKHSYACSLCTTYVHIFLGYISMSEIVGVYLSITM